MAIAHCRSQSKATHRTIPHPLPEGVYMPVWGPLRPGAEDALKIPSRINNRLVYRDGREEKLA